MQATKTWDRARSDRLELRLRRSGGYLLGHVTPCCSKQVFAIPERRRSRDLRQHGRAPRTGAVRSLSVSVCALTRVPLQECTRIVCRLRALGVCLALAVTLGGCDVQLGQPEIHLIPAGYSGDVFIIHDAPDGARLEKSGLARVYRIPRSGILRSKSGMNHGAMPKPSCFYITAAGKRTRIEGYWPSSIDDTPENRADSTVGIFFPRTGTYSSVDVPCAVVYEQYFVGTKGQLLSRSAGTDEARFQQDVTERPPCPSAG